jgi:plastocyanin
MRDLLVVIILTLPLIATSLLFYYFFYSSKKQEALTIGISQTSTTQKIETTTTQQQTTTTISIPIIEEKISYKEIAIYSDRFEPNETIITKNEKIKWINRDNKQHEIVCAANGEPLLDVILNDGESFEFSFFFNTECWDPSVSEEKMRMRIIAQ